MMTPRWRSIIAGKAAFARRTGAIAWRLSIFSCESSVVSWKFALFPPPPALLTSTSKFPAAAIRCSTASIPASVERSATSTSCSPEKSFVRDDARSSSRSLRRATRIVLNPCAASWRANSAPMPLDAPVTSATPGASHPIKFFISLIDVLQNNSLYPIKMQWTRSLQDFRMIFGQIFLIMAKKRQYQGLVASLARPDEI